MARWPLTRTSIAASRLYGGDDAVIKPHYGKFLDELVDLGATDLELVVRWWQLSARAIEIAPSARVVAERTGLPPAAKQGWTDVARFGALDVPAVNFGPGNSAQAHQAEEWVSLTQMEGVHAALRRLLTL